MRRLTSLVIGLSLLFVNVPAAGGSATDSISVSTSPATERTWTPVSERAFGLGGGVDQQFTGEDTNETLVFKGQLYLGMEADNALGARLWRTRIGVNLPQSQADWEEVISGSNGDPFGIPNTIQVDHIDSLAEFNGFIYASTANRGPGGQNASGILLFRSPTGDPGSWESVLLNLGPGFGNPANENFKDMQVFQGQLCGGTWNQTNGAQVWCSADGLNWAQKNISGFGGDANDPTNRTIWSGFVFKDSLYFGVQNSGAGATSSQDDVARLYRTHDIQGTPAWEEVYRGEPGSYRANLLGELNGFLYLSVSGSAGVQILRSPSGLPGSWTSASQAGINGDPDNYLTLIDGSTPCGEGLCVAVSNTRSGVQVWRTGGVPAGAPGAIHWVLLGPPGWGDPHNEDAQLAMFNGFLYAWVTNYTAGQVVMRASPFDARYVIVLLGDGMGPRQIEAADRYTGTVGPYESWPRHWVTTYPAGGTYDTSQAWSDVNYVLGNPTDSAAAASALFGGMKTSNQRISVVEDGSERMFTLADKARSLGMAVGAVTTVQISHATPGAWYAHNDDRDNGYAIADEGLWGAPLTTGTITDSIRYAGGHGPSLPAIDVLIGGGHPGWGANIYVNNAIHDKLALESGQPGPFNFVERMAGSPDGGARLLAAAASDTTLRLAGLFGGPGGQMEYRLASGLGHNPENPSLAEMAQAALTVLSRDTGGFVLMIEGGSIDKAGHSNRMDPLVGEVIGFNQAVQTVIAWVDDPDNAATWENTLVIVTADHETGYLTAAPGVFSDQPLGEVSDRTLALEQNIAGSTRRASWDDANGNQLIDAGETVYWAWNSTHHTNSLVPVYAKGAGAELFAAYLNGTDPHLGPYLDNTDVFSVANEVLFEHRLFDIYFPFAAKSNHEQ